RRPEPRLDDRLAAALAQEPALLAPGCRALAGLARTARRLRSQARGRPNDSRRGFRLSAGHVRHRARPGRSLPLPPDRLRRLVGRGPALALVQPLPPRALRLEAALSHDQRGPVALA